MAGKLLLFLWISCHYLRRRWILHIKLWIYVRGRRIILCTLTTQQHLLHVLLIHFRDTTNTKHNPLVSIKNLSVTKVVISRDSGFNSIWWYAQVTSSLLKIVLEFISCKSSSTVGIGWRTLLTAVLAWCMSTHNLMSSTECFGTHTKGETHEHGSSLRSMMSRSRDHKDDARSLLISV